MRAWEVAFTYSRLIAYAVRVWRLYRRVKREENASDAPYVDDAMRPLFEPAEPESDADMDMRRQARAV